MKSIYFLDPNPSGDPVVLLLHGLGADCTSWSFQMQCLIEAGFRPIAVDIPGFGKSPYDGLGWTISGSVEKIVHLLKVLELKRVSVVGISMGGTLALQLALSYPDFLDKLVLVSTFAAIRPNSIAGWWYLALRFILVHTLGMKTQAAIVSRRVFPNPGQEVLRQELIARIVTSDPKAYRAAMRAMGRFNVLRRLREVKSDTLVITGDMDSTVSSLNQLPLVRFIPHAKQVVIPGAGHAVSIDKAEEFNQELLEFLYS